MKEERYITRGGIEIYGIRNPSQHGFFASLFLRSGSMYESDTECGITHLLEHILIKNVNRVMNDTLYRTLDRLGIEFNAGTYSEMVQFYVSGAAERVGVCSQILTKLLSDIVLTADEVNVEKNRVKAEIREASERTSLSGFTSAKVFEGTSLARPITGSAVSVSKITLSRLKAYKKRVFTRENIFFYLSGNYTDEDVERLISLIDEYDIPSGERRELNLAPVPTRFMQRLPEVHIKNADFCAVRFTFDIDMSEFTLAETDLLYDILLSGYNSRFFIEMSERRGLFYDVGGALERYKNIGTLHFTYELRPESLYEALGVTVDILNSLKTEALAEDECMRASYVDNAYMLYDDNRELNFTFAYDNHIMGAGYGGIEERKNAYEGVTPKRLSYLAKKLFVRENLTFTMKGNKKKTDAEKIGEILSALG